VTTIDVTFFYWRCAWSRKYHNSTK